jgi:polyisoprenoid-binding protein YceI
MRLNTFYSAAPELRNHAASEGIWITQEAMMIRRFMPVTMLAIMMVAAIGCAKVGDAPRAKVGSALPMTEEANGTALAIDTAQSKVSWIAAKITRTHNGGFGKFDGTVRVNDGKIAGVKVNVDAGSIYTDDEQLVKHLKSDDFFAVDKFPEATFEANQFMKIDTMKGATHMVTGNLTMHGVTHSVTFPAAINVSNDAVTARADFKINRKDWGIVYPGKPDDIIADDVRIIFDIAAKGIRS